MALSYLLYAPFALFPMGNGTAKILVSAIAFLEGHNADILMERHSADMAVTHSEHKSMSSKISVPAPFTASLIGAPPVTQQTPFSQEAHSIELKNILIESFHDNILDANTAIKRLINHSSSPEAALVALALYTQGGLSLSLPVLYSLLERVELNNDNLAPDVNNMMIFELDMTLFLRSRNSSAMSSLTYLDEEPNKPIIVHKHGGSRLQRMRAKRSTTNKETNFHAVK